MSSNQKGQSFLDSSICKISKYKMPNIFKETSLNDIPIEQVFAISQKQHTHWGLKEYPIMRAYEDPLKSIQEIKKKGRNGNDTRKKYYVTRKGHYLEDLYQITKGVPGSNEYHLKDQWSKRHKSKDDKIDLTISKSTYIDNIIKEQSLRYIPGPGLYNLDTVVDKVKEASQNEIHLLVAKRYRQKIETIIQEMLQEKSLLMIFNLSLLQFLVLVVITIQKLAVKKVRVAEKGFQEMRRYHNELQKKISLKKISPGPSSYSPKFQHYKDNGWNIQKDSLTPQLSKNFMISSSSTDRLYNLKNENDKKKTAFPSPGAYQLIADWGDNKKRQEFSNWMKAVSKGPPQSIYY